MTGTADTEPPDGQRLVTDEVMSLVGTEVTYRAPEPLGAASIRHYALAIGADPDDWRHEAPPTLVCETTQLTGRRHPDANGYLGHAWDLPFPRPTWLPTGLRDWTDRQRVRVGDRVGSVGHLGGRLERRDATGEPMAIVTTTATYRCDETVLATNTETLIYRAARR